MGLWWVVGDVREGNPRATVDEVRQATIAVLEPLVLEGYTEIGDLAGDGGFRPWDMSPEAALERVDREWGQLGRDPNLWEICWLHNTAKGDRAGYRFGRDSVGVIVRRYAHAAAAHRRAGERGDGAALNAHRGVVASAYRELRRRGEHDALLPLLSHDDLGVRGWAAAHALEFAPEEGERVLEELRGLGGYTGAHAESTLEGWRAGELRFQ